MNAIKLVCMRSRIRPWKDICTIFDMESSVVPIYPLLTLSPDLVTNARGGRMVTYIRVRALPALVRLGSWAVPGQARSRASLRPLTSGLPMNLRRPQDRNALTTCLPTLTVPCSIISISISISISPAEVACAHARIASAILYTTPWPLFGCCWIFIHLLSAVIRQHAHSPYYCGQSSSSPPRKSLARNQVTTTNAN
jgi:hypothetical protein